MMAAASVMMFWLLSLKMEINWGRWWFWVSLRIGLKVCDCDVNNIFYLLLARTVTLEKSVAGHTIQTVAEYIFLSGSGSTVHCKYVFFRRTATFTTSAFTSYAFNSAALLARLLLIYRPRRDGRLSWPSCLTHSGRLTHKVVTRQPWIRRRSGKVRRLQTNVLTTEPRRQPATPPTSGKNQAACLLSVLFMPFCAWCRVCL